MLFKIQYRTNHGTLSTTSITAKSEAEARAKFRQSKPKDWEIVEVYKA